MMKKAFITGSNGQLGRELSKQLSQRGIDFAGYDIPDLDISDYDSSLEIIEKENPDIIINCAAMTNVDGCETDEETAYRVNEEGARVMAKIAAQKDIPIVHVSTDYVFDGDGIVENGELRPYIESDPVDPQSVYGKSKAKGEDAVREETDKHFIIRTAWLYGDGHNFVKTMLRLAKDHPVLTVVDDQVGSPTSTVDLANAIIELMDTEEYGTYHGTCEGVCSWADFAAEILRQAGSETTVTPVSSEEYAKTAGRPVAKRPAYSVLENKHLNDLDKNVFRPWPEALTEYLQTINVEEL